MNIFTDSIVGSFHLYLTAQTTNLTTRNYVLSISSDTKFLAYEMYGLKITCTVESKGFIRYTLQMEHCGKTLTSTDYMTVSDLIFENDQKKRGEVALTILKSETNRDKGDYKCIVIDNFNNTNSVNATVTFITNSSYMMTPKSIVEISEKGIAYVQFFFKFTIFPPAIFHIFRSGHVRISDVVNPEKYEVLFERDIIKFKVKFPDVNDFGFYRILIKTITEDHSILFELIVLG